MLQLAIPICSNLNYLFYNVPLINLKNYAQKFESDTKVGTHLTCSERHLELINTHYLITDIGRLSQESSCPQPSWLADFFSMGILDNKRVVTGISVGLTPLHRLE